MSDKDYIRLSEQLDKLPNGFPATTSGLEIRILKKIFTESEVSAVCYLSREMETIEYIVEKSGLQNEQVSSVLQDLSKRGLLQSDWNKENPKYGLRPFIPGFYEAHASSEKMDHEFAHLFEKYMSDDGAAGIMKPQPALLRIIPALSAIKSEWILPYDDVKSVLQASKSFQVIDCICRKEQDLLGRQCDFPLKVCLNFSPEERSPDPNDISRQEALDLLDKCEEIGLVHSVSNAQGYGFLCNCCGCCCGVLRGITDWGIENSVACSNYYAIIQDDKCVDCKLCIKRCQVNAITDGTETPVINRGKCIGCGLCVTGCPKNAVVLQMKPADEIVHPPVDLNAWARKRQENRVKTNNKV